MEPTNDSDILSEDAFAALAAKQRFESFRLGKGLASSQTTPNFPRPSHSRNTSISSSVSTPSLSTSHTSSRSSSDLPTSSKRPNSHHRRRSSVSTRRESADMMGVAVPDLPASSDDNINLGDKDSIRRRALWALEGKPDVPFTKVEIPELASSETEKRTLDFANRPSYPPVGSATGFNASLNPHIAKRDSFKLLASSSSSKDQLHTLVEEEEEEEEVNESDVAANVPDEGRSPTDLRPTPLRPRPAKLSLRPLSLTPESVISKSHGLPTPPSTGSTLKSLSLRSSLSISNDDLAMMNAMNRPSNVSPTPSLNSTRRRSPLLCDSPSPVPSDEDKPRRQSSISYIHSQPGSQSVAGLPTPDLTPTSERRFSEFSLSNLDDDFSYTRPLSASEQHFLFKSHNALLARITDLERALSSRTRPPSCSSTVSSSTSSSEPSDEMLRLIADLKSERDDLKRDIDGWRTRVSDLEKQISNYARRVEAERRDAWVARSRVGLFEIEKTSLEKEVGEKTLEAQEAQRRCDELKDECNGLRTSLEKMQVEVREKEVECSRLRAAYEEEMRKRVELERELDRVDLLATPTARAFETQAIAPPRMTMRDPPCTSVDSESSTTDVESVDFPLKAIAEDDAEDDLEEENELLRYEDEEDFDIDSESLGGSSCDSLDQFPRATSLSPSPAVRSSVSHPKTTAYSGGRAKHASRSSLSRSWTFPKNLKASPVVGCEEVDHFFGCLESADGSSPLSDSPSSYEVSKNPFAQGLHFGSDTDDDGMPPFLLPRDVGVEVDEHLKSTLYSVGEEDGEHEVPDDIEAGGIKIVFTPPQPDDALFSGMYASDYSPPASSRQTVPVYDFSDEDDAHAEVPFHFGHPVTRRPEEQDESERVESPPRVQNHHSNNKASSQSSIPRVASLKFHSPTVTPPRHSAGRYTPPGGPGANTFTPPTKRGGAMPSFIPQPVSNTTPPKQRLGPVSTFIPQPQRKSSSSNGRKSNATNGSTFQPLSTLNQPNKCRQRVLVR